MVVFGALFSSVTGYETKEQELEPCLVQVETGLRYFDAIDEYPSKYHYVEYEEIVEEV